MNPEYQRLRAAADQLFHRFNDVVDDKAAAGSLLGDIRGVVEECEMSKNPHSIEDRVKRIIEDFKELKRDGRPVMDPRHYDEFIDGYEHFREEIRELSNY